MQEEEEDARRAVLRRKRSRWRKRGRMKEDEEHREGIGAGGEREGGWRSTTCAIKNGLLVFLHT